MGLGMGAASHVRGAVCFHQLFKAGPGGFALLRLIIAQDFLTDIRVRTGRKYSGENQHCNGSEAPG